jgi:hypothetical protein
VSPPEGACFCRIRLRLKGRVGNPPSIKCESLDESAIQAEIDASEAFKRTLEACNEKAPLGERPWVLDADIQFFGSDGGAIDGPQRIEVTYFGNSSSKDKKKRKSEPKEVAEAVSAIMPSVRDLASVAAREATAVAGDVARQNMELLKQALADLRAAYSREADRVDSAIEQMADRANGSEQKQGQSGGGLGLLVDLLKIGKEAKSFLN